MRDAGRRCTGLPEPHGRGTEGQPGQRGPPAQPLSVGSRSTDSAGLMKTVFLTNFRIEASGDSDEASLYVEKAF